MMESLSMNNLCNLKTKIMKITSEDIPSITHLPSLRKNSESPIIHRKYTQENIDVNQILPTRIKSSNLALDLRLKLNLNQALENNQNLGISKSNEKIFPNKNQMNFLYENPSFCVAHIQNKSSFYKNYLEEQNQGEKKINSEKVLYDEFFESESFIKEKTNFSKGFESSEENMCYQMLLKDMIYSIKSKNNIPPKEMNQYKEKTIQLPPSNKNFTVILDLDETLAHLPRSDDEEVASVKLSFDPDNKDDLTPINIRPYTKEFLNAISNFSEVILFTA